MFPEIANCFDDVLTLKKKITLLKPRIKDIALLYGEHDPFVAIEHGYFLGRQFERPVDHVRIEAHFSGEQLTKGAGLIRRCDSEPFVSVFLGNMIINSDPTRFSKLVPFLRSGEPVELSGLV